MTSVGRVRPLALALAALATAVAGGGRAVALGGDASVTGPVGTVETSPAVASASPPTAAASAGPYASRPDLVPPSITVTTPATGTAPGLLLATPITGFAQGGPMVFDNTGEPVWYRPAPNTFSGDLEIAVYQGRKVLVWFEGLPPYGLGSYRGVWRMVDDQYRDVATIQAGNGLKADMHDIEITPAGTALIDIYRPVVQDLTAIGGRADAIVLEAVIQEIDIATGAVLFEWRSLDHLPVTTASFGGIGGVVVDYVHINTVTLDLDGNILISLRNLSQIVKIDRTTGAVLWRLGGVDSDFTFTDGDPGPSLQHDVHRLPDGTLTLFDNAVLHTPPATRGVAYRLDEAAGTATPVAVTGHTPQITSSAQGNYQTLPDGGHLLGWGSAGLVTEVGPAGVVRFEAALSGASYRTFRAPWQGRPARPPDIAVTPGTGGPDRVAVSWNGATGVARWQVWAGPDPSHLTLKADVPRSGFETTVDFAAGSAFVQVRARSAAGVIIGRSAVRPIHPWFVGGSAPAVSGRYRPVVGDFTGTALDDILWYAPGSGVDYLATASGGGAFTTVPAPPVNGTWSYLVGDFAGDGRDDILWHRPGEGLGYVWTSGGSGSFAATAVTLPAAPVRALMPTTVVGAKDAVLSYGAGTVPDGFTSFRTGALGLTAQTRTFAVTGTYRPVVGDFDGNGAADVFWYAPGSAADAIWYLSRPASDAAAAVSSVPASVLGSYVPLVGRFEAPGDRTDDLLFYAPGAQTAAESWWRGRTDRTFAKHASASAEEGFPIVLPGAPDHVLLWTPGVAERVWLPSGDGPDVYRDTLGVPAGADSVPVVGRFSSADATSILWYRPGGAAESLVTVSQP